MSRLSNSSHETERSQCSPSHYSRILDGAGLTEPEYERLVVRWPAQARRFPPLGRVADMSWPGAAQQLRRYFQEAGLAQLATCQTVTWRAVASLLSTVCIAGPRQGWIFPVLSLLQDEQLYSSVPAGAGPRVVVLCPGHAECGHLAAVLRALAQQTRLHTAVVASAQGAATQEEAVQVANGCDILLTTPSRLAALLTNDVVRLGSVCHLIVESAHHTLEIHEAGVENFLLEWRKSRVDLLREAAENVPDQVLVFAEEWNKPVEHFVSRIMSPKSPWNPVLVFVNLAEASLHRRVRFFPTYHHKYSEKLRYITTEFQKSSIEKQVICFSDRKYLWRTHQSLTAVGISVFTVNPEADIVEQGATLTDWSGQAAKAVLLVTDASLATLLSVPGCSTAVTHFDIPPHSKKIFSARFSFMKDYLSGDSCGDCRVHVLLGDDDSHAFSSLYSLLVRAEATMPDDVRFILREKHSGPVCRSLLEGRPNCLLSCNKRHWLRPEDQGQEAGQVLGGTVTFQVLRVVTPVCYIVTIKTPELDLAHHRRILAIARHFSNPSNIFPLEKSELLEGVIVCVMTGLDCVVYSGKGDRCGYKVFTRARVTKVPPDPESPVQVRLLDTGEEELVAVSRLVALPHSLGLAVFPAAATEVRLVGVVPSHRDPDWSEQCTRTVAAHLISTRQDREEVCRGRVVLHTSGTLLVDLCQLSVRHPSLGTWVTHLEVASWLLTSGWGEAAPAHTTRLRWLAEKAGLRLNSGSNHSGVTRRHADADDLQTSFLPIGQSIVVSVSEVISTEEFYVQITSRLPSLNKLHNETDLIGGHLEGGEVLAYSPAVGDLVIIKTHDRDYNRGRVTLLTESHVSAFLVDSGRSVVIQRDTCHMFPCPQDLVTSLPAQAIRCSLAGVEVVSGDMTEAGDKLYELATDPDTDTSLDLVCVAETRAADGGYRVKLYNTLHPRLDYELGDCLVKLSLATPRPGCPPTSGDLACPEGEEVDWLPALDSDLVREHVLQQLDGDPEPSLTSVPCTQAASTPPPAVDVLSSAPRPFPADKGDGSNRRNCEVLWSQTPNSVTVRFVCHTFRDIEADNVSCDITEDSISLKVTETVAGVELEHGAPCDPLVLHQGVAVSGAEVAVAARCVTARLTKLRPATWTRLGRERWAWLRRDGDTQEEAVETGPAECYTRPEVKPLPEAVFEDDDEDHDSGSESNDDTEEELENESEKEGSFEEAD